MSQDSGLGRRLRREAHRISSQHRQLDEFYLLIVEAMETGSSESVGMALTRFADALEAHFTMEENVHFPALHGLRPALSPRLSALEEQHQRFRGDLFHVRELATSDLAAAETAFDLLVTALAAHELEEERILEEVRPRG